MEERWREGGREEQANSGKVIQAYSPIGSYLHTKKRHS